MEEPISAPQHHAIIVHHEGTETLILQESFTGLGQDFAWIIPTPAYPEVALASPGLFPTLHFHTQPLYDTEQVPWIILALGLASVFSVFVTLVIDGTSRDYTYLLTITLLCLFVGSFPFSALDQDQPAINILFFTASLALPVLLALMLRLRVGIFAGLLLSCVLLSAIMVPNYIAYRNKSRVAGGAPSVRSSIPLDEVRVHERKQVGLYDLSILSAQDPNALLRWFQERGYQHNAKDHAIIQEYVQRGWFFIAARVRPAKDDRGRSHATADAIIQEYRQRGGLFIIPHSPQPREESERAPHGDMPPLQVSFAAAKPIYPFKLAALGPGETEMVLYVFAPTRVQADGFMVTFAEQVQRDTLGRQRIADPAMAQFIPPVSYLTKLEAKREQSAITADVGFTVSRSQKAYRLVRYSHEVLRWMALDGGLLGSLLTIVLLHYGSKRTVRASSHAVALSSSVVVGLLIAICLYYVVPPVPTARVVWHRFSINMGAVVGMAEGIRAALESYAADSPGNRYPPTPAMASYTDLVRIVNANGGTLPASEESIFFAGYTSSDDGKSYTLILAVGVVSEGITDTIVVVTPEEITRCLRGHCS